MLFVILLFVRSHYRVPFVYHIMVLCAFGVEIIRILVFSLYISSNDHGLCNYSGKTT